MKINIWMEEETARYMCGINIHASKNKKVK